MDKMEILKQKKLERKYKDILSYKDLIRKVNDFDEKLKQVTKNSNAFDDELKSFRDKDQKKIRDF